MEKEITSNRNASGVSLRDYAVIIGRRWKLVAAIAGIITVAGVGIILWKGPSYESIARVLVNPPQHADAQQGRDALTTIYDTGEEYSVASHAILIGGSYLKGEVANSLGGKVSILDPNVIEVGKKTVKLDIKNPDDTEFLVVTGTSTAPDLARQTVSTLIDDYLARLRQIKVDDLTQAEQRVRKQLAAADLELGKNRLEREEIEEAFGAPSPDKDVDKELMHLTDIQTRAEQARSDARSAAANVVTLREALRRQPVTEQGLPNGEADSRLQMEEDKLADLVADRTALLKRYTEANPQVIDVQNRINGLEQSIQLEKERYQARGLKFNDNHKAMFFQLQLAEAAMATKDSELASLTSSYKDAKERMQRFPSFEVDYAKANATVTRLESLVQAYHDSINQLKLREATVLPNARVIDPAPEATPSGPGRLVSIFLILAVGLILGSFGAIIVEQTDDSVAMHHGSGDLGGLPLVGAYTFESGSKPSGSIGRQVQDSENGLAKLGVLPASGSKAIALVSHEGGRLQSPIAGLYAASAANAGYQVHVVIMDKARDADAQRSIADYAAQASKSVGTGRTLGSVEVGFEQPSGAKEPHLTIYTCEAISRLASIQGIAASVDAVVFVLEAGVDTKAQVTQSVDDLKSIGIRPAGAVLSEVKR